MGELLDMLLRNPLLLIILGGMLLQGLGTLGAKAARKPPRPAQTVRS